MVNLPDNVKIALQRLHDSGYSAYVVGGSVRDSLMGLPVHDWDITTSALPSQTKEVFSDCKTVDTGIKHGTVTLIYDDVPLEITTFRTEGEYLDCRRPSSVSFTDALAEDLVRRDFTINAMVYSEESGVIDLYGGIDDINNKIIRAVGNPVERFEEDALRIMRALRFSARLGFTIEENTARAALECRSRLRLVSAERIAAELCGILCAEAPGKILSEYAEIFFEIIPELRAQYKHTQFGKKHAYDIWEHTCHTIDGIEPDRILRLTMLLHDSGKPACEGFDAEGNSTFKGHASAGEAIARPILEALRLDKRTINTVAFLVGIHDKRVPTSKQEVKLYLKELGDENFQRLMKIRRADRGALAEGYNDISELLANAYRYYDEVKAGRECYNLSQLAVKGSDIIKLGYSPSDTGAVLDRALELVIQDKLPNQKEAIILYLKENKEEK